ncbi:MAG: 2-dehydropantoate 2-reductase [Litorimonas sp.]
MKIVILGAGSIGCYLGGILLHAGQDVSFIGRAHYKARLTQNGLRLTHFTREPIQIVAGDIDYHIDAKILETADIVALCTKSQDTKTAAQQIRTYCKANTLIISFQNGVGNADTLKTNLSSDKTILRAIVPFNVTPAAKDVLHCGTDGALVIEASHDARLTQLKIAFETAGQAVTLSENIIGDQWAKMIVNLNNGLNVLSGGTLRGGLLQRDYRRALALVVSEALSVAKANNIRVGTFNGRRPEVLLKVLALPNFAYRVVMQFIVKIDVKARSSMLDDLEAGRASEIYYLQGEILRHAKLVHMDAPYNETILKAVLQAFEARNSPRLLGSDILKMLKI